MVLGALQEKDNDALAKLGGTDGLAAALKTDLQHGLNEAGSGLDSVEAHRAGE
jgi:hypothetical protein